MQNKKIQKIIVGILIFSLGFGLGAFVGTQLGEDSLEGRVITGTGIVGVTLDNNETTTTASSLANSCGSTNGKTITQSQLSNSAQLTTLLNNLCARSGTYANLTSTATGVSWNCGARTCSAIIK